MAIRWILIRHPDKEGDKEGIYPGRDAKITDLGRRQIKLVTARLKLLMPNAVTCSEFPRTHELAKNIAKELLLDEPAHNRLLNEMDKPKFLVKMSRKDPVHIKVMQAIRDQFDDDTVPVELLRGEKIRTRSELERDMRLLFHFIETFRPDPKLPAPDTILSITHAKMIAAIFHWMYCKGTLKGYYQMADEALKISTTGITILDYEPNRHDESSVRWKLTTFNEESHTQIGFDEELRSLLKSVR